MELTSVKAIVCLVPTDVTDEPRYTSANFEPHTIKAIQHVNEYQLSMLKVDEQRTQTWKIDDCMTMDTEDSLNKERAELVDFAMNGYDVACLSLSVCYGSRRDMYDKRKQNLESIFSTLKEKINTFNDAISVQYAYVGITDETCYDLRKESPRSNEYMLEKGVDSLMKKVDNIDDIWDVAEKGSTLPFILAVKLKNESQKTVGRLVLIDLLSPKFSPLMKSANDRAHYTFSKLCDIVRAVTDTDYYGHWETNTFLIHEIAKYITGHNKLTIFGYINDTMVNDLHSRETTLCLDFITSLRKIPVRMISNQLVESTVEYRCLVGQKNKIENYNEKLQKHVSDLKAHIANLKLVVTNLRSEKGVNEQGLKDFVQLKTDEIELLKATIADIECNHAYEISSYRSEMQKLNTMVDCYKYLTTDIRLENEYNEDIYKQQLSEIQDFYKKQLFESQERNKTLENQVAGMTKRLNKLESEGLSGRAKRQMEAQLRHALKERERFEEEAMNANRRHEKLMAEIPTGMETIKKNYQEKQVKIYEECKSRITAVKSKLRAKIEQLEKELNMERRRFQDNSSERMETRKRRIKEEEYEDNSDDDAFETLSPVPASVNTRRKAKQAKKSTEDIHMEDMTSDDEENDKRYKTKPKRSTRSTTPRYNDKAHLDLTDNTANEEHQEHDKENKVDLLPSPKQPKRKRGRPPQKKVVEPLNIIDEEMEEQDAPAASPPNTEAVDEEMPPAIPDEEIPPTIPDEEDFSINTHKPTAQSPQEDMLPDFSIPVMDINKKDTPPVNEEDLNNEASKPANEDVSSNEATTSKPTKKVTKKKPTPKKQNTQVDDNDDNDDEAKPTKPTKKARGKKTKKQDPPADDNDNDDDAANRSPILGATDTKPDPTSEAPTSTTSSQPIGSQKRRRKLIKTRQSESMVEHLHGTNQMSPLSQLLKNEKFIP